MYESCHLALQGSANWDNKLCCTALAGSLKHLDDVQAWEFNISTRIIALKSSLPQQWLTDFKEALGKQAPIRLETKGSLLEIYRGLGDIT